jgi:hypothetical protein
MQNVHRRGRSHLVVYLVGGAGQRDLLREDAARLLEPLRLLPVVEGACHEDFGGGMLPAGGWVSDRILGISSGDEMR